MDTPLEANSVFGINKSYLRTPPNLIERLATHSTLTSRGKQL